MNALARPQVEGILPGPALTEAIWVARRKGNQSTTTQIAQALFAIGLRVEHPIDDDVVRAAELIEISDNNPGPPRRTRTGLRYCPWATRSSSP